MDENSANTNPQAPSVDTNTPQAPAIAPKHGKGWIAAVAVGALLAIAAWGSLIFNEYVSFWSAAVSFVLSIVGAIKIGTGAWRNLAITACIACGALLIVFAIFYFGISYALKAI